MPGYAQDKDAYLKRLRRIEGQVRGPPRMADDGTYCIAALTQISATRALQAMAVGLLEEWVPPPRLKVPRDAVEEFRAREKRWEAITCRVAVTGAR